MEAILLAESFSSALGLFEALGDADASAVASESSVSSTVFVGTDNKLTAENVLALKLVLTTGPIFGSSVGSSVGSCEEISSVLQESLLLLHHFLHYY